VSSIAKVMVGVMVGFAALAVLSLLWLALRARKRAGVGRKAGALSRSLYPVLLGLGGWFLGVLSVQAIAPNVPLDNGLLAVLSVGTPIGLGIYWAWVRRSLSPRARTAGFVAAVAGAFVGAWFGFQVTAGVVAVFTTIIGAATGANLILLVIDSARDRTARVAATATPRPAVANAGA
jgi:hypothetical protein